jgi:hypothetical protein
MRSLRLNLARRPLQRTKGKNGINIFVGMPENFMPDAIHFEYHPGRGELELKLEYFGDREQSVALDIENDDVKLLVGKNTAKLHTIIVQVDRRRIDAVNLNVGGLADWVGGAIDEAIHQAESKSPKMRDNYRVAEEAIAGNLHELLGAIQ